MTQKMIGMKTSLLTTILASLLFSQTFAFGIGNRDTKGNGEKELKADSVKVETVFEMTRVDDLGQIEVLVSGQFNDYASVAITNLRGSELNVEFINSGENKLIFDVSDLREGAYFLVLNMEDEIRIKRFSI